MCRGKNVSAYLTRMYRSLLASLIWKISDRACLTSKKLRSFVNNMLQISASQFTRRQATSLRSLAGCSYLVLLMSGIWLRNTTITRHARITLRLSSSRGPCTLHGWMARPPCHLYLRHLVSCVIARTVSPATSKALGGD